MPNKTGADITKEFIKDRERLWAVKGKTCIYCGKPATELHHIIPRHMGGDNRLSNIVPLCYGCHQKAHSKRGETHAKMGRKEIPKPSNFDEVADRYLDGVYKLSTALELTGLKRHRFYKYLHEFAVDQGREYQLEERRFIQNGL